MGLAATQMRFLALTAKKSNSEYQGQQINQQRLNLANQSSNIYNEIADAQVPIPPGAILKNETGLAITVNGTSVADGNYYIEYKGAVSQNANCDTLDSLLDTTYANDLATYNATLTQLEAESANVQQKDKKLELQLKRIDTDHSAIKTEIDAIKKILDDNVESSFKTFA